MFMNARSILNKLEDLKALVYEHSPDVIGITESWAHTEIMDAVLYLPGYTMIRKDRCNQRGGGLLLYIEERIIFERLPETEYEVESIWIQLKQKSGNTKLAIFYRPPDARRETTEKISQEIDQNTSNCNKCVIIGDFNMPHVNWNTFTGSNEFESFYNACQDNFLVQLVQDPTRGRNVLDLILTNSESIVTDVKTGQPLGTSDHNTIEFSLCLSPLRQNLRKSIPDFRKTNFDAIRRELEKINWEKEFFSLSVHQAWSTFRSILSNALQKHIKYRHKSLKSRPVWFTNSVKIKQQQKLAAWKKYKVSEDPRDLAILREKQKLLKAEICRQKSTVEEKLA